MQKRACKKSIYACLILIIISSLPLFSYCQADDNYDEISVTLNVQRIGSCEIPSLLHGEAAYLPVKEVFDFLKIKNFPSPDFDTLQGFLINPKSIYLIDKPNNKIFYDGKVYVIKPGDLIHTSTGLYLKSDYFDNIFGLTCAFNFRSLSVKITTTLELPAIRELQQEQMRKNITQLSGERKADTTLKRLFSLFHLGMADWSIINTNASVGKANTRISLNLGAFVAGGEANVYLNYNNSVPFNPKQQFYRWRFINNENAALRQVTAGNIFVQATSSIYGAVTGVQFSNTPTTYRRSFGTYRLSNTTEPGWMVELYVNNVLVNYTKADASGFYTFEVPLVYGNSAVKLRFFGPWGEERVHEQNISIPFNFLPKNQFEYTLTAGVVADDVKSKFSRLNLNYGLGSHITVGGGMEYLSSVRSGKSMPFLNTSLRIGSGLLLSGEHSYGVRSKGIISYRLPSNLQFEANYIKYAKGQTAIRSGQKSLNNYLEEKKLVVSFPFSRKKFVAFSRFSFNQLTLTNMKYNTAEFLLSSVFAGINSNFTTSAVYSDPKHALIYSTLSATFRLPKGLRLTPQTQYEHTQKKLGMIKCEVEKNLFNHGFLNFSYERNMAHNNNYIGAGIRYNFSFAQTSFSTTKSSDATSVVQSARGSLMFDEKSAHVTFDNQTSVGRGGLVVVAFLDINGNGNHDINEPKIPGLKLRINGGRILHNKRDTSISIIGLESYTNYFLELDRGSFDNVSWQIKKKTMNVSIDPNHFKLIEVPVAILSEVSGTVYLKSAKGANGIGRILVNIFNENNLHLVAKVLTESDGYFNFAGLAPGSYTAAINNEQLLKLHMTASPAIAFKINSGKDGDVVDGLKLYCQVTNMSLYPLKNNEQQNINKDTDGDGVPDIRDKELITSPSCFPVDADGVGKCTIPDLLKIMEDNDPK